MTPAAHRPAGASGAAWLALLAVALLAATGAHAGVSPDSALARTGRPCASPGSTTLVQTRSVRVYSKRGVKVACHMGSSRRTAFANSPRDCPNICFMKQLRTAGVMVAYDLGSTGRKGTSYNLRALNTRTGRFVRDLFQGESVDALPRLEETLAALQVRSNGSIVWISDVRVGGRSTPQTYEVRRADTGVERGAIDLLDSSPDIDPNSLALDGANAHWTRAGEPRSAPVR
jgi:hypothetical protein